MRATILHPIDRPLAAIEGRLLAPSFLDELATAAPILEDASVTRASTDGPTLVREAVYRVARGPLGPIAWLGEVGWAEQLTWSRERHEGEVVVRPFVPPFVAERLTCEATYRLDAQGEGTLRSVDVLVEVRLPGIGRMIERLLGSLFETQRALLSVG